MALFLRRRHRFAPRAALDAVAAAWTPASVTTAFWYDASNTGSITKDGSNNVSQWNDLSGNARHLTQSTAANKPVYTTGVLNALAGVYFQNLSTAAANKSMSTSSFTVAQPFTIVAAIKTVGNQETFGILIDGDSAQAGSRAIIFTRRNDLTDHAGFYGGTLVDPGLALANATAYHLGVVFNGGSSSTDVNGTTTATGLGALGIINGILAGCSGANNGIDAYVCEMFCITDAANLANGLAYILNKWGV